MASAANILDKLFANTLLDLGAIPPPPSSQKTTYTWGDAVRPTMAIGAGVGALGMAVLMM